MLYQKTLASEKSFVHSAHKNYVKKNNASPPPPANERTQRTGKETTV